MFQRNLIAAALLIVWLAGIGIGFSIVGQYEATPGRSAEPSQATIIPAPSAGKSLLMFAHPQCPCSRATLVELEQIMRQCRDQLRARVYFLRPAGFAAGWEKSDLWRHASAIPGVECAVDDDGVKAQEFGAQTSGQVIVFDETGRRIFQGGITGSRGHQGDNPGRQALLDAVLHEIPPAHDSPVFGCPLFDSRSCCEDSPQCPK